MKRKYQFSSNTTSSNSDDDKKASEDGAQVPQDTNQGVCACMDSHTSHTIQDFRFALVTHFHCPLHRCEFTCFDNRSEAEVIHGSGQLTVHLSRPLSLSPLRPFDARRPAWSVKHERPKEASVWSSCRGGRTPGAPHSAQQGRKCGVHHLTVQLQQHHSPCGRQEASARVW